MTISAQYNSNGSITVNVDGVISNVPNDLGNRYRQMIADWEALGNVITPYVAPVIDLTVLDQNTLNAALVEPGSVVRALGLIVFDIARGVIPVNPAYTMTQYVNLLKAKMR